MLASNSKKHCSAHINKHHTPSMLEVGYRQLRCIDWAGRPICIFLLAFQSFALPADKKPSSGAPAQSAATLCAGCVANCLRHFYSCAAAAPSGWTPDHSQRVAALHLAPRCSTSQTLPSARADFQSRSLLHTSSAPTAFRFRKM